MFRTDQESLDRALRRLAFEEFFYLQLGVMQRRREIARARRDRGCERTTSGSSGFSAGLPFELTGAQRRVLGEVLDDMGRTTPMTRLVQGDVGSGKTVVAAAAMWRRSAAGAQSALLAPTQILAEQHYRSLSRHAGTARTRMTAGRSC